MRLIKYYREMKGWTQEQLALESGVSQAMISAAERGERIPRIPVLRKLAKSLGVDAGALIDREEGGTVRLTDMLDLIRERIDRDVSDDEKRKAMTMMLDLLRREIESTIPGETENNSKEYDIE